jgi:hypothetical protein
LDYDIKNFLPMLSEIKIIALYCIVDDLLKELHHYEDAKVRISDSEVITTAFVSVLYFGGHLENGQHFMKMKGSCTGNAGQVPFFQKTAPALGFCAGPFLLSGQKAKRYGRGGCLPAG